MSFLLCQCTRWQTQSNNTCNLSYVTGFQWLILLCLFFFVLFLFGLGFTAPWTPSRVDMCALSPIIIIIIVIIKKSTVDTNRLAFKPWHGINLKLVMVENFYKLKTPRVSVLQKFKNCWHWAQQNWSYLLRCVGSLFFHGWCLDVWKKLPWCRGVWGFEARGNKLDGPRDPPNWGGSEFKSQWIIAPLQQKQICETCRYFSCIFECFALYALGNVFSGGTPLCTLFLHNRSGGCRTADQPGKF